MADRRVERTRRELRAALVALILEKGYDAVTIQDILDRADVGRSTFYAHYHDKEALLLSGFTQFRTMFEAEQAHATTGLAQTLGEGGDFSLVLFRHAAEQRLLIKALIGQKSGDVAVKHFRSYLVTYLRERLKPHFPHAQSSAIPLDAIVEYLVSSLLGLLIWWLDQELRYTPEQIDAIFKGLTLPGLTATVGGKLS